MKLTVIIFLIIALTMMMIKAFQLLPVRLNIKRNNIKSIRLFSSLVNNMLDIIDDEEELKHLCVPNSKIHPYWLRQLTKLEHFTARSLISQLVPDNEFGYDNQQQAIKPTTFLAYALEQKKEHVEKIVLVRCGDFYETYGIDSLMLVEYAGLNPMGNKLKAGCPARNVQYYLNHLTEAGLSIAIYEELSDNDANKGPSSKVSKIKERYFSQVVSPGSPLYSYNLCLKSSDIEYKENYPAIGVLKTVHGFTFCEIRFDEKTMSISERMTDEAIRVLLESTKPMEPLYIQDIDLRNDLTFLSHKNVMIEKLNNYDEKDFPNQVLRKLARDYQLNTEEFRIIRKDYGNRPSFIYTSTAIQIGLSENQHVPDLVKYLLPKNQPAHSYRFLRKWLLFPPSTELADHMQNLCRGLENQSIALPPCRPIPVAKVVSLLFAKQCNRNLILDIRKNTLAVKIMLESSQYNDIVPSLMEIVKDQCGNKLTDSNQLLEGCNRLLNHIDDVIALDVIDDPFVDESKTKIIPEDFFKRNEEEFRGNICIKQKKIQDLYNELNVVTKNLVDVVQNEYPINCEILHDINNNLINFKTKATSDRSDIEYISPIDRFYKPIPKRYTTTNVQKAVKSYCDVTLKGTEIVTDILQNLCEILIKDMFIIEQIAHWAVVLQAVNGHVISSKQKKWIIPNLNQNNNNCLKLDGVTPYWLDRNSAASNDIELEGLFLLTAPNMSGKSTLMRSSLVAALLANCGLYVPCKIASVPRYDRFFLRTASYDVPNEQKSAFAVELDDMRIILRDSTKNSLVMIDEFGKGTSSKDGASLAGALLEFLDATKVNGIFATHLHELLELPLELKTVKYKRMGMDKDNNDKISWTYTLEDGICTDSMALVTAKEYKIQQSIIDRADYLGMCFQNLRNENDTSIINTSTDSNSTNNELSIKSSKSKVTKSKSKTDNKLKSKNDNDNDNDTDTIKKNNDNSILSNSFKKYSLVELQPFLIQISGVKDDAITYVDHNWDPPAKLEGNSCVYVLHLEKGNEPDIFYVGETESIHQRLSQHRKSKKFHNYTIKAAIICTPNKSSARSMESLLIKSLQKKGYELVSDTDSSHSLFS